MNKESDPILYFILLEEVGGKKRARLRVGIGGGGGPAACMID